MEIQKKIVVGISGASGVIYGIRLLESLSGRAEVHLIITDTARKIISTETDLDTAYIENLADFVYSNDDLSAPPASGSFLFDSMVILPCSIKSLSGVVNSYADTLLIRTADVALKEKRRLVLGVREMPFHEGHLKLMAAAAGLGAVICPPVPAFYNRPHTISDLVSFVAGRVLDLIGIEEEIFQRWEGVHNNE